MATLNYPTNAEINEIAQSLLPDLGMTDLIFQLMPIITRDTVNILWEQEDDYYGLQQIRGMNGEEPKVQPLGAKQYQTQPGVYGEQIEIKEREMLERRQYGTLGAPITLDDLVMRRTRQLLTRQIVRQKQILWTLISTGTFSVAGANGAILQTDTFPLQTYAAGVAWATTATATPLADLSNAALQSLGYSVSFNASAMAIMNRVTFNAMRANTNAADLGGRRTGGFGTFNTQSQINELLTGDDLPNVLIYDKSYKNDAGTATRYIPNNKVILVGSRDDGAAIGNYVYTRNASHPDFAAAPWMSVVDNATPNNPDPSPRKIVVHSGHNGAPIFWFPSAVIVMSV